MGSIDYILKNYEQNFRDTFYLKTFFSILDATFIDRAYFTTHDAQHASLLQEMVTFLAIT